MSDEKQDGGPAFPVTSTTKYLKTKDGWRTAEAAEISGLSLRDYFAAHAPVDYGTAEKAYGTVPMLSRDDECAAFNAVWTFLRYQWADAMLAARERK